MSGWERRGSDWCRRAVLCLFTVALCACSAHSPGFRADDDPLRRWVEKDLGPYLVEQLGRHPRFKGAPILIVKMAGADVQPEMDELTAGIRDRLNDILIREPTVHLAWRPTQPPWEHHRTLAQLQCRARQATHYVVGIETKISGARELEVSVRALDLREREWVRGVGRSWRGRASASQVAAFQRHQTDRYLRGLRVLPFTETEIDLAAEYLALNLSCLLQQRAGEQLTVHPEVPPQATPILQKSVALVANYLAQFREVTIVGTRHTADVVLRGEMHRLDDELHQLWIVPQFNGEGEYLAGVDTETYVRLGPQVPTATQVSVRRPIARQGRSRANRKVALLADFQLFTPPDPTWCRTTDPWVSGERAITVDERLSLDHCFALEVALSRPASVFLLSHDSTGRIIRLLPDSCGRAVARSRVGAGQRIRFPRSGDLLEVDGTSVTESFYAIAVTDPGAARRLARKLAHLPSLCTTEDVATVAPGELEQWLLRLERSVRRASGELEWRVLQFRHRSLRSEPNFSRVNVRAPVL